MNCCAYLPDYIRKVGPKLSRLIPKVYFTSRSKLVTATRPYILVKESQSVSILFRGLNERHSGLRVSAGSLAELDYDLRMKLD